MPVQDSDIFLVNRAGASYKVQAQNLNNMQDTDIIMIDDGGVTKKVPKTKWFDIPDSAWTLCNSGGSSYKVSGANFKSLLTLPPFRGSWTNSFFIGNDAAGWDNDSNSRTQVSQNSSGEWSLMTFNPPLNIGGGINIKWVGPNSDNGIQGTLGTNVGTGNERTTTVNGGTHGVPSNGSTLSNIGVKMDQSAGFVFYFYYLAIGGRIVTDENRGIF